MSDSYSIYFKADLMCLVHDSQKKSTDEYPFEIQYADKLPGGLQIIRLYVSEKNLSTGFGIHGALELFVGDRKYETQDEEERQPRMESHLLYGGISAVFGVFYLSNISLLDSSTKSLYLQICLEREHQEISWRV